MSRDRQKASDVWSESNPMFGKKTSFEEAFPQIDSLDVTVEETGKGVHREPRTWRFSEENPPGKYVDCSNDLCYNGGVDVGSILRAMVRNDETSKETTEFCQGYEGSPKGQKRYKDCINKFEVQIEIEYADEDEQDTEDED